MPSIKSDDCKECRVKACGEKFKTRHEYNGRRHMLVHLPKGDKYNEALEAFVKSQIRQADKNFEDVVSEDDDMESVIPPVNLVTHTSTPILKDAVECKVTDKVVSGSDGETKSYSVIPRWTQEVSTYKVKGQKKTLQRHTTYYQTIFWPKDLPPPPPSSRRETTKTSCKNNGRG
ncbi:hypothetical protein LOTGIDRAFT_158041 [Lottia gigantea]|uniref:Uncharacterized protein n=1 Tax=Lottia gigantea TaxID=225164 RepID=V4AXY8_LOTGI|nr:hypothetical protein LOTGIDRAFT_158041 [Lottia gigantea]ESO99885.1 hypothetical protein LOTGIDRAFT_158041 [Lottia gigantea]